MVCYRGDPGLNCGALDAQCREDGAGVELASPAPELATPVKYCAGGNCGDLRARPCSRLHCPRSGRHRRQLGDRCAHKLRTAAMRTPAKPRNQRIDDGPKNKCVQFGVRAQVSAPALWSIAQPCPDGGFKVIKPSLIRGEKPLGDLARSDKYRVSPLGQQVERFFEKIGAMRHT
jgi:hypothetical protein